MTTQKFYEMIKEYARREMEDQTNKYLAEHEKVDGSSFKEAAHIGASNEAEKFLRLIISTNIEE